MTWLLEHKDGRFVACKVAFNMLDVCVFDILLQLHK